MEGNREMACPDPSAHDHHNKLSEQASTAALYATDPARHTDPRENALGSDGKLSARSAAASLKYARPQDLPSYPSSGLSNADSAGKAAMLAKDYKMKELWHPELSAAGSKAALLAHRDGGKLDLWQPTASKAGNSAATLAMRTKGLSPELDRGYTADGKQRALLAATLSVSRSGAAPPPVAPSAYPDSKNAGFNALNAATKSHRANSVKTAADKRQPDGWNSDAMQAARVKHLGANMAPEMFGEHPPVEIEQEEKKHNAALRASAVSMAKQMYELQNRTVLGPDLRGGVEGAGAATARQQPSSQIDVKQEALRYIHLQDAAHKLAQERLAKVDKTFEAAKYREYYGYPDQPQSPPKKTANRLSMRSKDRRRATGDGNPSDSDSDDEGQAQKIRHQMTQLHTGLNSVDEQKRTDDRARVYAAAEKKVHAQMHNMDEKVFADTGKVPPAMMEEWEAKARARAVEEKREQAQHPGQTHIGGGKYIATAEIEAIAAARLKPTLDEISVAAEKRRARDQEVREEKEEAERGKREGKARQREEKEEGRRVKNEEKAAKKQHNEEVKARKSLDQRRSREVKRESGTAAAADEDAEDGNAAEAKPDKKRSSALGRITSRLRRGRKGGEEPGVPQETEKEGLPTTAVAGTAAAGATTEGAPVTDATKTAEQSTATNTAAPLPPTTKDEADAVSEVEDYEVLPAPPSAAHAAENDRDSGLLAGRPNLAQHYSHIGDSSDEEWDEDEEAGEGEGGFGGGTGVAGGHADKDEADGIQDAFARADQTKRADELAEKGKRLFGYGGGAGAGAAGTSAAGVVAGTGGSAGVAEAVPANSATVLDPDHQMAAATEGEGEAIDPCGDEAGGDVAERSGGLHQTVTANKLDPNVPVDGGSGAVSGGLAGDMLVGPGSDAFKPQISSNAADTVDPGVKSVEPSNKLEAREKQAGSKAPAAAETEQKGLRGFFGKFRKDRGGKEPGRISNSGMKYGGSADGAAAAAASGTAATTTMNPSEKVPAADPAGQVGGGVMTSDPTQISASGVGGVGGVGGSDPRAISPSSFRRRSGELDNLSDVSSSGAEEEDLQRGRGTGPGQKSSLMQQLGLGGNGNGKGKGRETVDDEADGDGDGDADQFEEARDHFDERLAPPPAFGGQAKSGSPVRETRFREDV
ncbi:hypothetical protein B0A55_08295 [Friedmanniomyces simplex]|uniref:Eisosome protein 1 n=1 Tax=Friedmanniomyces simplex TaxID=329884 RepID=A0A4V5NFZ3_9PEZI|nr:hypothetical protein B0A55_08295 [Friedmanniomyces simplex]